MLFNIQCVFDKKLLGRLEDYQLYHTNYFKENVSLVRYGGVLLSDDGEKHGICYVLEESSMSGADLFTKNDPFFELFDQVEIRPFEQRIPAI
jgi:hypothetical protein